jgi:ribosome recycling factor
LTEERRRELVKQTKEYAEDGRIAIRNIRRDILDELKKDGLSEDVSKNIEEKIQEVVNEYNKKVELIIKEKDNELMNI